MNTKINDAVFDFFPTLETERLILRNLRESDSEALFRMRNNDLVMEYVDSFRPKTIKEAFENIQKTQSDFENKNGIRWAITIKGDDKLIGDFSFWRLIRQHVRAEIGYMLMPEYWRKGIMSEAIRACLNFGFTQFGLHSLEANVNVKNTPSMKILEKFGFQKEAHFRENYFHDGRFLDSIIYCLLEQDFLEN